MRPAFVLSDLRTLQRLYIDCLQSIATGYTLEVCIRRPTYSQASSGQHFLHPSKPDPFSQTRPTSPALPSPPPVSKYPLRPSSSQTTSTPPHSRMLSWINSSRDTLSYTTLPAQYLSTTPHYITAKTTACSLIRRFVSDPGSCLFLPLDEVAWIQIWVHQT